MRNEHVSGVMQRGGWRPRPTWVVNTVAVLASAVIAGACGPDEAQAPDTGPADGADEGFVMPLDTDVLLADLHWETAGPPSIGEPVNVTRKADYDNQPHFTPDGTGIWYTSVDPHTAQSDIYRYDIDAGRVARVTQSNPESEYSATPLPDGSGVSTIRVEADSTQRLWRFDHDGANAAVLFQDIAPVGYHAWVDENTVVMFVLGDPATLQVGDLRTGRARVVTDDIGRSIQPIPGTFDVSYVQRHGDGTSTIMRLPGDGGEPEAIIEAVNGGDFHAWASDGTVLMADGPVVFGAAPAAERRWSPIADFSHLDIVISRLAVSPDASQIALVAEPAPIELPGN